MRGYDRQHTGPYDVVWVIVDILKLQRLLDIRVMVYGIVNAHRSTGTVFN
jgi:hypothetical protein